MKIHKFDIEYLKGKISFNSLKFSRFIDKIKIDFRYLKLLFESSIENFYYSHAMEGITDSERTKYGKSALYSYTSYLLCVANPFKEMELEIIPNRFITLKPDEGNYDSFMNSSWFTSMLLAIIYRNNNKIEELRSFELGVLNQQSNPRISVKFLYMINEILYKWDSDVDVNKPLNWLVEEINETYDSLNKKIDNDRTYFRYLRRNFILGLKALKDEDENALNESLEQCVKDHHDFYKQKRGLNPGDIPLHDEPEGMISLMGIALAAMAYDKGWKINYESDYLPKYLIQGKFE